MNLHKLKWTILVFAVASILVLGACRKKVASLPTPSSASPPAPTVSLTASPSVIEQGQSSTLTWETQNATDPISSRSAPWRQVARTVTPVLSATCRLVAKDAAGSDATTARVTVECSTSTGTGFSRLAQPRTALLRKHQKHLLRL